MKSKLAVLLAILTVVGPMVLGPAAYAELGDGDSMKGQPQGPMAGLNMTPEQSEKIRVLQNSAQQQSSMAEMKQMQVKMQAKMQELDAAVDKAGTKPSDVKNLLKEISTMMKEMSALQAKQLSDRIDRLFAMKEMLPPEQFAKMRGMEKAMMQKGPGSGQGNSSAQA